jgi:aspartate aminotransferase-like enzyme
MDCLVLGRIAGLRSRRNTPFTPGVHACCSMAGARAYNLPRHQRYTERHGACEAEGFVTYAGQSDLARTVFRNSTVGRVKAAHSNRLLCCAQRV